MVTNRDMVQLYSTTCYRRPLIGAPLAFNLSDASPSSPLGLNAYGAVIAGFRALQAVAQYRCGRPGQAVRHAGRQGAGGARGSIHAPCTYACTTRSWPGQRLVGSWTVVVPVACRRTV